MSEVYLGPKSAQAPQSQQSRAAAMASPAMEKRGRRKLMREIQLAHAAGELKTIEQLLLTFAAEVLEDV